MRRIDSRNFQPERVIVGQITEFLTKELEVAFLPETLEVINESHLHKGHQPQFDGEGETHFRIRIVAAAFQGMSRVERHRRINKIVESQMEHGLHAIAIEAHAPNEQSG